MKNYKRDEDTVVQKNMMEIKSRMWLGGMFQVVKSDTAFSKCSRADVPDVPNRIINWQRYCEHFLHSYACSAHQQQASALG